MHNFINSIEVDCCSIDFDFLKEKLRTSLQKYLANLNIKKISSVSIQKMKKIRFF